MRLCRLPIDVDLGSKHSTVRRSVLLPAPPNQLDEHQRNAHQTHRPSEREGAEGIYIGSSKLELAEQAQTVLDSSRDADRWSSNRARRPSRMLATSNTTRRRTLVLRRLLHMLDNQHWKIAPVRLQFEPQIVLQRVSQRRQVLLRREAILCFPAGVERGGHFERPDQARQPK